MSSRINYRVLVWIVYKPEDGIMVSTIVSRELTSDLLDIICHLHQSDHDPLPVFIFTCKIGSVSRRLLTNDIRWPLATILNPPLNDCISTFVGCWTTPPHPRPPPPTQPSAMLQLEQCVPYYRKYVTSYARPNWENRTTKSQRVSSGLIIDKEIN